MSVVIVEHYTNVSNNSSQPLYTSSSLTVALSACDLITSCSSIQKDSVQSLSSVGPSEDLAVDLRLLLHSTCIGSQVGSR